jgi:hypothetical protein
LEELILDSLTVIRSINMDDSTCVDLYDSTVDKLKEIKGGE